MKEGDEGRCGVLISDWARGKARHVRRGSGGGKEGEGEGDWE